MEESVIHPLENAVVPQDGSVPTVPYLATKAFTETSARRSATARTLTVATTFRDVATANRDGVEPDARKLVWLAHTVTDARIDVLVHRVNRVTTSPVNVRVHPA